MSEPIKVGDLVVVVRGPHCCLAVTPHIGSIFRVTEIRDYSNGEGSRCMHCRQKRFGLSADGHPVHRFFVSRLKRIPPLGELDDVKQDEEITA